MLEFVLTVLGAVLSGQFENFLERPNCEGQRRRGLAPLA
jgi:hypothetical protein